MLETVSITECICVAETPKAILVESGNFDQDQVWIPKSQIDDDSDIYEQDCEGTLVVSEWFAKKECLV